MDLKLRAMLVCDKPFICPAILGIKLYYTTANGPACLVHCNRAVSFFLQFLRNNHGILHVHKHLPLLSWFIILFKKYQSKKCVGEIVFLSNLVWCEIKDLIFKADTVKMITKMTYSVWAVKINSLDTTLRGNFSHWKMSYNFKIFSIAAWANLCQKTTVSSAHRKFGIQFGIASQFFRVFRA